METSLLSISKIFTERIFRIPDYQRGYAWTEKQLKDFWNDLVQLEDNKNHYVGVLTLENVPQQTINKWEDDQWIIKSKSYEPYYIVDGQQRLTTTIILIQAIIEKIGDKGILNYTNVIDIKRKFIFETKAQGVSRSYIFGYEKDNPSYEFLKTKIFLEKNEESIIGQETIYTHNLEFAKKHFLNYLQELNISEVEILYKKLTQNFLFNIYTITNDIDVFIAFETMNNRGKPLSHLELLKNRLIFLSTKFNAEEYEKNTLRKKVNECWKSIYHNLGKNKDNPLDDDKFLVNHFLVYFGEQLIEKEEKGALEYRRLRRHYGMDYSDYLLENIFSLKRLSEKKDKKLTMKMVDNYVNDLKYSIEIWHQLYNPDKSEFSEKEKFWLEKLNRAGFGGFAPLLLVFFKTENRINRRVKFLELLEKTIFFYLLHNFRYYYSGFNHEHNLFLAVQLKQKQIDTDKLIKDLEDNLKALNNNKSYQDSIRREFKNSGFYKWDGIKYFLYEYEQSLKAKSKTNRQKINWKELNEEIPDYKTIEHIYPQNPRKKCWTDLFSNYTAKERSVLRHSLGNLLPLSQAKNSSFGNKCFKEKVGNSKNTVGYKYGSYSENEISSNSEWTAKDIIDRGLKLLYFMEENWDVKIGTRQSKIDFLNLTSVDKKINPKRRITTI